MRKLIVLAVYALLPGKKNIQVANLVEEICFAIIVICVPVSTLVRFLLFVY